MSLLMRIALVSSLWLIQIDCSPYEKLNKGVFRFIEGDPAETGQIPWQVKLNIAKEGSTGFECGGSLISEKWVLTAAHCVVEAGVQAAGSDVKLIAGSLRPDNQKDGQRSTAQKIIVHPEFDNKWLINDIALIQLATPFRMNAQVHVIRLSDEQVEGGTTVYASGWGKTEKGYDPELNYGELKTISNDECAKTFGIKSIDEGDICTTGENGKTTCKGDSGGPLFTNNNGKARLVGIVSGNAKDCPADKPSIFARVSFYRNWIKENSGI